MMSYHSHIIHIEEKKLMNDELFKLVSQINRFSHANINIVYFMESFDIGLNQLPIELAKRGLLVQIDDDIEDIFNTGIVTLRFISHIDDFELHNGEYIEYYLHKKLLIDSIVPLFDNQNTIKLIYHDPIDILIKGLYYKNIYVETSIISSKNRQSLYKITKI